MVLLMVSAPALWKLKEGVLMLPTEFYIHGNMQHRF